jgi:hypothetical protein
LFIRPQKKTSKSNWDRLVKEFPLQLNIINYLEKTYLPLAWQFIEFAVKNNRNFSFRTTSRVESAHHELKSYLKNRFSDLYELQRQIRRMLTIRREAYQDAFVTQRIRRRILWDNYPILKI